MSKVTFPKVLHLVVKHKWYDMIESGEKGDEYRDWQNWGPRICAIKRGRLAMCPGCCDGCKYLVAGISIPSAVEYICFHRGYTNRTMTWELLMNKIGTGRPEWGAPEDERVLIFSLYCKVDPVTLEERVEDWVERMRKIVNN